MESWQPISDRELAFFFEDDIEVSPLYFEYSLVALKRYGILAPSEGGALRNPATERLVGISLNTPRYDEINMPPRDWIPQQEIGEGESHFLFQLPCSWGALYFPWRWREFLEYYEWRRNNTPDELHRSIPDSATMFWRQSWKKYLIEFMYMRGQFMLYPSLPRQLSFSTHHREPGEHTDARPQEHLVDDLGTLVLDYFTVPLLGLPKHRDQYERLLAEMKPLRELPILSFHHERVRDMHSLTQLGLFTVRLMTQAGWDHSKYQVNPPCILDSLTFPLLEQTMEGVEAQTRYLLYEPQGSLAHQMTALRNGIAYAKMLNRTLVVPPVVAPGNHSVQVALERIVDLQPEQLEGRDGFIPMVRLETFARSHHGWVERITQFVPWSQRKSQLMSEMRDDLLTQLGLVPAQQAILHAIPTLQNDILVNFAECTDPVLSFRHLFLGFTDFVDEGLRGDFAKWSEHSLRFAPPLNDLFARVKRTIRAAGPVACVVYSRGDMPEECGNVVRRMLNATDQQRLVAFRSCQPSFERTLEYAIEDSTTLNITLSGLYAIVETAAPAEWKKPKQGGRDLGVFTREDIRRLVQEAKGVGDLPPEIQGEIVEIAESDLCIEADFFLGNTYSTFSNRIASKRSPSLPSNKLGFKVAVPPAEPPILAASNVTAPQLP